MTAHLKHLESIQLYWAMRPFEDNRKIRLLYCKCTKMNCKKIDLGA